MPTPRVYNLREIDRPSLNEDVGFKAIDTAIDLAFAERKDEARDYPFKTLMTMLNMPTESFAKRLIERITRFDLESLKIPRNFEEVCVGVETITTFVVSSVTACKTSAEALLSRLRDRLVSSQSAGNSNALRFTARHFLGCSDKILVRVYFAQLLEFTSTKKELVDLLEQEFARALIDVEFLATLKERKYIKGRSNGKDEDLSDDESEQGEHEVSPCVVTLTGRRQLELKVAWSRSSVKLARGISDLKVIQSNGSLQPTWSKPRVSLETILNALRFLETLSVGWKGGATQSAAISDECKLTNLPVLNMAMTATEAYDEYRNLSLKHEKGHVFGAPPLGRDSFRKLFTGICKIVKEKHALSYYFTGMLHVLTELTLMVQRMKDLWLIHHSPNGSSEDSSELDELGFSFDDMVLILKGAREHATYGLRTHIKLDNCDGVYMHCAQHAIGGTCTMMHSFSDNKCDACQNFTLLTHNVQRLMNAVANSLAREHRDAIQFRSTHKGGPVHEIRSMGSPILFCRKTLDLYHRHVVRGVVMNRAIAQAADSLAPGELIIIVDHKQKIQPISMNESSEDYYGKKGISLLGLLVRWRSVADQPLETRYIDIVSNLSKQDVHQVQQLLAACIPQVKQLVPTATTFTLVSDNGSAFSGADNIQFCFSRNQDKWDCDLVLKRWLYFEAQCGKTTLDTHFSFVNIALKRYAREVGAVRNHKDVFEGLKSGGGIANSIAIHALFNNTSEGDDEINDDSPAKLTQVRKIHDVHFNNHSVTTFHYAGVKTGMNELSNQKKVPFESRVAIAESFTCEKVFTARKTIAPSSQEVGVKVTRTAKTSPLDDRYVEACETFTSTPTHASVPVLQASSTAAETSAVVVGSKKKKAKVIDQDDALPSFGANWATADMRPRIEMSNTLTEVVTKMVSQRVIARVRSECLTDIC